MFSYLAVYLSSRQSMPQYQNNTVSRQICLLSIYLFYVFILAFYLFMKVVVDVHFRPNATLTSFVNVRRNDVNTPFFLHTQRKKTNKR